jgi:hypothetical protein
MLKIHDNFVKIDGEICIAELKTPDNEYVAICFRDAKYIVKISMDQGKTWKDGSIEQYGDVIQMLLYHYNKDTYADDDEEACSDDDEEACSDDDEEACSDDDEEACSDDDE